MESYFFSFLTFCAGLITAGVVIFVIILLVDMRIGSRRWQGETNDHFDGRHFFNLEWTKKQTLKLEEADKKTGYVYGFLRFLLERHREKWRKQVITPTTVSERHTDPSFRITHIGHATVLIQIAGLNIITDPVYSHRVSPVPFAGPRRYTDP